MARNRRRMLERLVKFPDVDIFDGGKKVGRLPVSLLAVKVEFRSTGRGFPRDTLPADKESGDLADLLFRVGRLERLLAIVVRELIEDEL